MKYLVVTSHDERYDFNFVIKTVNVNETSEIFAQENIAFSDVIINDDGVYEYHKSNRDNYMPCGTDIAEDDWKEINKKVERVTFNFCIAIPFELLLDDEFYLEDYIVERNSKYGFLDGKYSK